MTMMLAPSKAVLAEDGRAPADDKKDEVAAAATKDAGDGPAEQGREPFGPRPTPPPDRERPCSLSQALCFTRRPRCRR